MHNILADFCDILAILWHQKKIISLEAFGNQPRFQKNTNKKINASYPNILLQTFCLFSSYDSMAISRNEIPKNIFKNTKNENTRKQ